MFQFKNKYRTVTALKNEFKSGELVMFNSWRVNWTTEKET